MDYRIGDEVFYDDELEDMTDDELHILRLRAEKVASDQSVKIKRGKLEWEQSGRNPNRGLSPSEYNEASLIRDEAQSLIKAIDIIFATSKEE